MIYKYDMFLFDKLCESLLLTSSEFSSILTSIDKNKVRDDLSEIIYDKKDIKTNYNAISISNKNDEVTFTQDNKIKNDDPWSKPRSSMKIGRLVKQILSSNGYNVSQSEVEQFVNYFKSEWDSRYKSDKKISIVKGEDIYYWYNEQNYLSNLGTLSNSCMRYEDRNRYMSIYVENPDKVSLVIAVEEGKLVARALLWNIEPINNISIYLDRIYTRYDSDYLTIKNWVLNNVSNNIIKYDDGNCPKMRVLLKNSNYDEYPYMDTFVYLHRNFVDDEPQNGGGFLSNREYNLGGYLICSMNNTDGSVDGISHKYSQYHERYIENEYAVFDREKGSYIDIRLFKYSKYLNSYYNNDECVFSEKMNDWVPNSDLLNDEVYGIIAKSYMVNVIVDYIGGESNPFKVYTQIKNISNRHFKAKDLEQIFKIEKKFKLLKDVVICDAGFYIDDQVVYADINMVYPTDRKFVLKCLSIECSEIPNVDDEFVRNRWGIIRSNLSRDLAPKVIVDFLKIKSLSIKYYSCIEVATWFSLSTYIMYQLEPNKNQELSNFMENIHEYLLQNKNFSYSYALYYNIWLKTKDKFGPDDFLKLSDKLANIFDLEEYNIKGSIEDIRRIIKISIIYGLLNPYGINRFLDQNYDFNIDDLFYAIDLYDIRRSNIRDSIISEFKKLSPESTDYDVLEYLKNVILPQINMKKL